MNKAVQFIYQINKPGTASGELIVHDKKASFEITNVSNPLYDLLKGMVSLIFEPAHLWGEDNICLIDWYSDQSSLKWILSTSDGKELNIKIYYLDDIFDESSSKTLLNTKCEFQLFYKTIIQELDHFIKKIGLLNYEQLWQKDEFPLTYFLILKKHLMEHGQWNTFEIEESNFLDELDMLQA